MPLKFKTDIRQDGRVCTFCWEFKPWSEFSKSKDNNTTWYTPNCRACRNKYKAEYRAKTKYATDHKYKEKKRKLAIGDQILFNNDVREVLSYKMKKGYTVKSILNGDIRQVSTADNHYRPNTNCVRYRKMIEKIEITKPVLDTIYE